MTGVCLSGIRGGNAGKSHRCDPEKLADQGHRVGGELSAAGTRSGTCSNFKRSELCVRHSAAGVHADRFEDVLDGDGIDRKSTRLNSSHGYISYAVFCLKKKKKVPAGRVPTPLGRLRP